jgi:hypothetical protein
MRKKEKKKEKKEKKRKIFKERRFRVITMFIRVYNNKQFIIQNLSLEM